MTSGPKRNSRKGSTNPAKSTALPKTPNWSRSIRNISSAACKKFATSVVTQNRRANLMTAGILRFDFAQGGILFQRRILQVVLTICAAVALTQECARAQQSYEVTVQNGVAMK